MPDPIHDPRCIGGWIDLVHGCHPVACSTCKPDRVKCRACGWTWLVCETRAVTRYPAGQCCADCTHVAVFPQRSRDQMRHTADQPPRPRTIPVYNCTGCRATEQQCESKWLMSGVRCCADCCHEDETRTP